MSEADEYGPGGAYTDQPNSDPRDQPTLEQRVQWLEARLQERVEAIKTELEVLRVAPDEALLIRINPELEDSYPGFLDDMNTALVQAGLGGRVFVLSLRPRDADVVVIPKAEEVPDPPRPRIDPLRTKGDSPF